MSKKYPVLNLHPNGFVAKLSKNKSFKLMERGNKFTLEFSSKRDNKELKPSVKYERVKGVDYNTIHLSKEAIELLVQSFYRYQINVL